LKRNYKTEWTNAFIVSELPNLNLPHDKLGSDEEIPKAKTFLIDQLEHYWAWNPTEPNNFDDKPGSDCFWSVPKHCMRHDRIS
jgi:hypothetical protein